jgi:arylsulfatase A-like enzyme
MIQLNSISAPIMSAASGSVTPNLNALKNEGIYFSNFFNNNLLNFIF